MSKLNLTKKEKLFVDGLRPTLFEERPAIIYWDLLDNGQDYTVTELIECETCLTQYTGEGMVECCGENWYGDGPTRHVAYVIRTNDPDKSAKLLGGLDVCIVTMVADGRQFLVSTASGYHEGNNICEAYIRLGYLPPLVLMRSTSLDSRRKIIAMEKSHLIAKSNLDLSLNELYFDEKRVS